MNNSRISLLSLAFFLFACEVHNSSYSDNSHRKQSPSSSQTNNDTPPTPNDSASNDTNNNGDAERPQPIIDEEEARRQAQQRRLENFQSARAIINTHCFRCHGVNARAGDFASLDEAGYLNYTTDAGEKLVLAGNPMNSELYFRLKEIFTEGDMPSRNNRALNRDEADVLLRWINEIEVK